MSAHPEDSRSAVASAKRFARLLLAVLSNRAELLLVEVQEERHRLLEILLLMAVLVVVGTVALTVVTFTLVILLWEQRVWTLVILSLLYLGAGTAVFLQLRRRLRNWEAFSATLDEFEKDREWLKDHL